MIRVLAAIIAAIFLGFSAPAAKAQDAFWVQIESNPTLTAAEASARRYSSAVDSVVGFRLSSGWYAIAAGPYTQADAQAELRRLSSLGLLPRDAYVEGTDRYGPQFWPVGDDALARFVPGQAPETPVLSTGPVVEVTDNAAVVEGAAAPTPVVPEPEPEETRREALQSERLLDRPAREELQIALQWFGFYRSGIDGAFGPGTRNSMAAWQTSKGFEPSGVLTTKQRGLLLTE